MNLKDLWSDKALLRDLNNYLQEYLKDAAIEKVFLRQDTTAIAEAKEVIDGAFSQLDTLFEPKAKTINLDNAR
jgi:hypothetical protein